MIFIKLIRPQHLWNHEDDTMFLRRIGAVREATVNMLANADFYGRRGVVMHKSAEGFRFANPGSMRVSLNEALQDSASDPRNGVMMKMLAMVEYGERAGSGLQGRLRGIKSNRDKVLRVLSMNSTMTLEEVAQVIGMSRIGVHKIVDTLKQEGILFRKGSNKMGEWIVKGGF